MPGGAEGGLPAKLAPKEQPKLTTDREQCIARGELRNSTAGEYLITGFEAEYGSVYGNGIQAEHTSTTCLFSGSKLRARCQRPNEDFRGFADNVMELVENCLSIRKCP